MTGEILDKFDFETQEDPRKDIRAKYRELFTSILGRQVLADILESCYFGSVLDPNTTQVMWYNSAIRILQECGMIGPGLYDQVADVLCHVVPKER